MMRKWQKKIQEGRTGTKVRGEGKGGIGRREELGDGSKAMGRSFSNFAGTIFPGFLEFC